MYQKRYTFSKRNVLFENIMFGVNNLPSFPKFLQHTCCFLHWIETSQESMKVIGLGHGYDQVWRFDIWKAFVHTTLANGSWRKLYWIAKPMPLKYLGNSRFLTLQSKWEEVSSMFFQRRNSQTKLIFHIKQSGVRVIFFHILQFSDHRATQCTSISHVMPVSQCSSHDFCTRFLS